MMAVWSTVSIDTVLEDDRFDGDYYKPDDLQAIKHVRQNGGITLDSIATILTGKTPNEYTDDGILSVVRSGDLVAPLIYPTCERLFHKVHQSQDQVPLKKGDILISSIGMGSIGKISLVINPANLITVSEVTILRDAKISPEYLFAYLASSIGQSQIEREITGATGQQHLLKSKVGRILVPSVPNRLEATLQDMLGHAHWKKEAGRIAHAEAEALLESALGLDKLDLAHRLFSERPITEVKVAKRFDAEYFQPKYIALIDCIRKIGPAIRLGDCLERPITRGVQPIYDELGDVPVINSQHVGKDSVDLGDNRMTSQALLNPKAKVKQFDVLLNSTGYVTIGRCQAVLEHTVAVVDGHVSIIRPKESLDPVYLAAFLNSAAGYLQTEQSWTGSTGQIELRLEAISDFVIWQAPR